MGGLSTFAAKDETARGESSMNEFRVMAIPTDVAQAVRATLRSPFHDFPVHAEVATDDAPCRHCLRKFVVGTDRRVLCTYDRFAGVESLPQPGPIYVHVDGCQRYAEDGGFPEELRDSPRTLEAYSSGRNLLARESVADGRYEATIERMLANPQAAYILVNGTTAGCFTFRIERAASQSDEQKMLQRAAA
jgi:hypothetical protein